MVDLDATDDSVTQKMEMEMETDSILSASGSPIQSHPQDIEKVESKEDDAEGEMADVEKGTEEDPYEVGWEGGDSDPSNPRSKQTIRKWLIVAICSLSACCV